MSLGALVLGTGSNSIPENTPIVGENLIILQENTVMAPKYPILGTKFQSLGVFSEGGGADGLTGVLIATGQNRGLIECLIKYESGGNIKAVGDSGKAYGILQFWRSTFDGYKKLYDLEWLEYENPVDQVILADIMLRDNLEKNIRHWTVYPNCYKIE